MVLSKLFDLLVYALTHVGSSLDQRVVVAPKDAAILIVLADGDFETFPALVNSNSAIVENRLYLTPFLYSDAGKPALQFAHAEIARLAK